MDEVTESSLRDTWERTLTPFGSSTAAARRAFADLAIRYSEPGRHYHTLEHIAAVLTTLRSLGIEPPDRPALTFAAFLHDVVCDSHASDNEERSAAYSRPFLQALHVPEPIIDEVIRLILLTKTHRTRPDDYDGQVLLDADLAILGTGPASYDRYAALIRCEYDWVPEKDYRAGRARVLEEFLRRSRIYATPEMHVRAEAAARDNLRRESALLRQGNK
jgi:predicted metal-dependent HD superfamily phosphohydrolase